MKSSDISGASLFANGAAGSAHVLAHRALDSGNLREGHRTLSEWLRHHDGPHIEACRRVHLHWHMLVFDLELGRWQDAYDRFARWILPGVEKGHAEVDAPAALWWLRIRARRDVRLPWEPVRNRALAALHEEPSPHVTLHHLLALAGSKDVESIDAWVRHHRQRPATDPILLRASLALRALGAGEHDEACHRLNELLPELPRLGGSRAQNALLSELREAVAEGAARLDDDEQPLSRAA